MKKKTIGFLTAICLPTLLVQGQGVFTYDQQSTNLIEGGYSLQSAQPLGQSFTPGLSSVDFVELNLYDGDVLHDAGATVYVVLRSDSILGPILGSSEEVFMANGFSGTAVFLFSTPVAVTSGEMYFFQPLIQSGNGWVTRVTDASYPGGSSISQGTPVLDRNLWFREGTYTIPEPSALAIGLLGAGVLAWIRRGRRDR